MAASGRERLGGLRSSPSLLRIPAAGGARSATCDLGTPHSTPGFRKEGSQGSSTTSSRTVPGTVV
eukprot:11227544-Lingulodinium_polyedra.AAC.1